MDFLTEPVPLLWWHLIVIVVLIWYMAYNKMLGGVSVTYKDPVDAVLGLVKKDGQNA